MHIRPERPEDYSAIRRFVETAFKTAQVASGTEQDFVEQLRAGKGYIPELALVAEEDGELAGHVMLTAISLTRRDNAEMPVLLLAPLSVALARRNRGIGSALVREALSRAGGRGYAGVFLCGNPDYYGRFGFARASRMGIGHTGDIPDRFVLGLELSPGALPADGGVAHIV